MRLRQLEYFVAVAEELHFTRAAATVGVSQPVLSSQIRALETELGVSLLVRTSRKVSLTGPGESFLVDARMILDQVDEAKNRIRRPSGQALRVGTYTSGGMAIERAIIREYEMAWPGSAITLVMLSWGELGRALREGRIDVAFLRTPLNGRFPEHENLLIAGLRRDPRVAVVVRDHPLAQRRELSIDDLTPYDIIFPDGISPVQRDWWIVNPRPDGSAVSHARVAGSVGEMLEAVSLTGNLAITTESVARIQSRPDLTFIPLVDVDPAVISLGWLSATMNPLVDRFLSKAKEVT